MKKSHTFFVIWSALIMFAVSAFSAELRISKEDNILPDTYRSFVVYIDSIDFDLAQFDLFIAIDQSYYGLISVTPTTEIENCGITDFHYQVWNQDTLAVLGYDLAGYTDGIAISGSIDSLACGISEGSLELARIDFRAADHIKLLDYECGYLPVKFYWRNCQDNSLTLVDQSILTASELYEWYDYYLENDTSSYSFPGFGITGADCTPAVPSLIAINGLLEINCYSDSYWWVGAGNGPPGDINLNDVPYELSDFLRFASYFVYGLSVFDINLQGEIASTDINRDGIVLSVPDLVLMTRIVLGYEEPPYLYYYKSKKEPVEFDVQNGLLTTTDKAEVALVVYEGTQNPTLLSPSAEMIYNYDQLLDQTRVLVYTLDHELGMTGNVVSSVGEIISAEVASINGSSKWTRLLPNTLNLHQNYPNPFNPSTMIRFDLPTEKFWEVSIYNLTGRRIRAFGGLDQGSMEIEWNGKDEANQSVASGVYFYRLQVEDQTQSRKMLLIK